MISKLAVSAFTIACFYLFIPVFYGSSVCPHPSSGFIQSGNHFAMEKERAESCFSGGREKQISFTITNTLKNSIDLKILKSNSISYSVDLEPGINHIKFKVPNSGLNHFVFEIDDAVISDPFIFLNVANSAEYELFSTLIFVSAIFSFLAVVFYITGTEKNFRSSTAILLFHSIIMFFGFYIYILNHWPVFYIGDEPHYMLMAESLMQDFDLNLENQYGEQTHSLFMRNYDPHTVQNGGLISPLHYPFLSLVLMPSFSGQLAGFYLNPVYAGKIISVLIASITAGFIFASFLTRLNLLTVPFALLAVSGLPMLLYSNQIYPEIITAFMSVLVYFSLVKEKLCLKNILFIPFISVIFLFLHLKYTFIAVLIILYWNYLNRKRFLKIIPGNIFFILGIILFLIFNLYFYGFTGPYGREYFNHEGLLSKYTAYLFDADRGIFALNPVLLFVFPGLILLFLRNKIRGLFAVLLLVFLHLPNLFHADIWLGVCPVGRYWISAYPITAVLATEGFYHIYKYLQKSISVSGIIVYRLWIGIVVLLSAVSFLNILNFLKYPAYYFTHLNPVLTLSENIFKFTGYDLSWLFFSYRIENSSPALIFWMVLLAVFIYFHLSVILKYQKK